MYSAIIAALTIAGFFPCTTIYDSACNSASIQSFIINGLEPFILQDSGQLERGFSLVWALVQKRWEKAQRDPIRVLDEECFRYYEVGQPGGIACSGFFNVYRTNRNEPVV